jgi:glycosyltransferase involved in cell wall biosynthesis
MRTLYICYFGLREPLVQTQVLPYLRELVKNGLGVALLTFEPDLRRKWTTRELEETRATLRAEGIDWNSLPYHKRPSVPATVYDIFAGAWRAARIARRGACNVLHARAHVPLAMSLLAQMLVRTRIVFDMRGLMAEEYADAGVWSEKSLAFRVVKRLEREGLGRADRIVVLTQRMRAWLVGEQLAHGDAITVVPCCVDLSRYVSGDVAKSERFEVVYAGSVTGLYMLQEMARFFIELKQQEPGALLRILTNSPGAETSAVLTGAGLSANEFQVVSVAPADVPRHLRRAHLGISFRKPTFSQIAASPTKIPEYLAAGLPVVSNSGIGDTDELLQGERVGVLVREFTREAYASAVATALRLAHEPDISKRCVEAARKHFDLQSVGGRGYGNLYRNLKPRADTASPRN